MTHTTPRLEVLEDRNAAYSFLGSAWPDTHLTFSLVAPYTSEQYLSVVSSLSRWSHAAPFHFTEVEDSGPSGMVQYEENGTDIRVHFNQQLGGFIAGLAYGPGLGGLAGDVFISTSASPLFLSAILTHEVGHSLGLGHSDASDAIMRAVLFSSDPTLRLDDVAGIQALYGPGTGSVTTLNRPLPPSDPPVPPTEPAPYDPFPGYRGMVTQVSADMSGDGVVDQVFIAIPEQGHIKATNNGREVFSQLVFPGFHGRGVASGGEGLGIVALLPSQEHFKAFFGGREVVSILVAS